MRNETTGPWDLATMEVEISYFLPQEGTFSSVVIRSEALVVVYWRSDQC